MRRAPRFGIEEVEMKRCTKCEVEKPVGEFYENPRSPDGLSYWCKGCNREAREERRARKAAQPD